MFSWKRAWPAVMALAAPLSPAWAAPDAPPDPASVWREQMDRVGEFPRGHADILRWERKNLPAANAASSPDRPMLVDEAVRLALALRPDLIVAAGPERLAERERHQAQLALATSVRQAWLDAVLAVEVLRLQEARSEVAEAGAELGRRMVAAGNWSAARGLRERVTQARESVALLQARQAERTAREALARQIGTMSADALTLLARRLPADVPTLPASVAAAVPADPETLVLQADAALAQQRLDTDRLIAAVPAGRLVQARQAREQALASLSATGQPASRIDITDPGIARDHALAEADEAAAALLRATAERRSQAREAWGRLQDQHALAQQTQSVLLPLLEAQEQETQLRYNGMLQSTWDLLEATRERMAAATAAAQARHGYWTALLDWELLAAGGPHRASQGAASPSAAAGAPTKDH
ncbi:hypothetical protein [Hydrogenophaga sp. RWCD_12]|uniref:hypothetical protein n=1 Tax=Hydrogenophaga sp. RWCD_12 TaxID=3391190 RepID=UPI003984F498